MMQTKIRKNGERNFDTPKYEVNDQEFNLGRMEISLIKKALEKASCNQEAADLLGITERNLHDKVAQYKIISCYGYFSRSKAIPKNTIQHAKLDGIEEEVGEEIVEEVCNG